MAAKKTVNQTVEVETEQMETKVEVHEHNVPKNKIIIAKAPTPFRKLPTLLQSHIVGQMPVGTAFEIVMTVKNGIGTFYKLNNGKYIIASGNYTIQ